MQTSYQKLQGIRSFYEINDVDVDRYTARGQDHPGDVVGPRPQPKWRAAGLLGGAAPDLHPRLRLGAGAGQRQDEQRPAEAAGSRRAGHHQRWSSADRRASGPASTSARARAATSSSTPTGPRSTTRTRAGRHRPRLQRRGRHQHRQRRTGFVRKAAFALRFGDINPLISSNISRLEDPRPARHPRPGPEPRAVPRLRPRPVPGGRRRPPRVRRRRLHDDHALPERPAGRHVERARTAAGSEAASFNYVRNSVKAVVDAYDGTVKFYVDRRQGPARSGPTARRSRGCSRPATRMPGGAAGALPLPRGPVPDADQHVGQVPRDRPRLVLQPQRRVERRPGPGCRRARQRPRHADTVRSVTDANAAPSSDRVDPTYLLMQLPGEKQESFLLLRPFVPTLGRQRVEAADRVHGGQERPRRLRQARDVRDARRQPAERAEHRGRPDAVRLRRCPSCRPCCASRARSASSATCVVIPDRASRCSTSGRCTCRTRPTRSPSCAR